MANYVEELNKKKNKPKIGKIIYAVFEDRIIEEEVIALSDDFFITNNYKNTDIADVDRLFYTDFEKTWFITLVKAKEFLSPNFDDTKFKVSEREGDKGERYWVFVDKNERKPRKTKKDFFAEKPVETTSEAQVIEKVVEKIVTKEVIKEVPVEVVKEVTPEGMITFEEMNTKLQNQKEYNIKITEVKILSALEKAYKEIFDELTKASSLKPGDCFGLIKNEYLPKYLNLEDETIQKKSQANKELKEISNKNKRKK